MRYQYKFMPAWRLREIQAEKKRLENPDETVSEHELVGKKKKRTSSIMSCFKTMKWEDDSMLNESSMSEKEAGAAGGDLSFDKDKINAEMDIEAGGKQDNQDSHSDDSPPILSPESSKPGSAETA